MRKVNLQEVMAENNSITRHRIERQTMSQQKQGMQMEMDSSATLKSEMLTMEAFSTTNATKEMVLEETEEMLDLDKDDQSEAVMEKSFSWIVLNLFGTHKCHTENSKVKLPLLLLFRVS